MRKRIDKNKRALLKQYEQDHKHTIKDYRFKPGDLVLMRNTAIKDHLNRKLKPRWLGPLIVIKQSRGGAYLLAEMDGSVLHRKVARFRVIPYFARRKISIPRNVHELIDLSEEGLRELEEAPEPEDETEETGRDLWFEGVRLKSSEDSRKDDQPEEPGSADEVRDQDSSDDDEKTIRPRRSLRKRS